MGHSSKFRREALCSLFAVVVLAGFSNHLFAQYPQPYSRYGSYRSPYGPTLPAELNYFRRDVGVLNNYQTFVRPQRELAATLRGLQVSSQRQQLQLQGQQQQLQGITNQLTPGPTGSHATFQNYSHYYSSGRAGRR
ncbi:MAG: hypothetical protein KDB14_22450 [Planctomycetales bacterium]|nr:hypothetical protein [Planctomycetales bacterium]